MMFPFCQVDTNLTLKAEPLMQVNTSQKVVSYPHAEKFSESSDFTTSIKKDFLIYKCQALSCNS